MPHFSLITRFLYASTRYVILEALFLITLVCFGVETNKRVDHLSFQLSYAWGVHWALEAPLPNVISLKLGCTGSLALPRGDGRR